MLRANSPLRQKLGREGVDFLLFAAGAYERILPHIQRLSWQETHWEPTATAWTDTKRKQIRVTIAFGDGSQAWSRSLTALIKLQKLPMVGGVAGSTLAPRERDICGRITDRISRTIEAFLVNAHHDVAIMRAIQGSFDEAVVAEHINEHHKIEVPAISILASLHTLSEQTYENKALVFGCVIDPSIMAPNKPAMFPAPLLEAKKYKALSDGFRTAYHVSSNGQLSTSWTLRSRAGEDLPVTIIFQNGPTLLLG